MRLVLPLLALALPLAAENWAEWRGPGQNGVSPEAKNLPVSWSTTENVKWRLETESWSAATPIVWGEIVFITSAEAGFNDPLKYESGGGGPQRGAGGQGRRPGGDEGEPPFLARLSGPAKAKYDELTGGREWSALNQDERRQVMQQIMPMLAQGGGPGGRGRRGGGGGPGMNARPDPNEHDRLYLIAVNRTDGTIRWKRETGARNRIYRKQNLASPSPVTDGGHVWTMTGSGELRMFDFDGEQKWTRNLEDDYGSFGLNWGYASSPRLHEGVLYIQVLHGMTTDDPSYVLAVDAATGQTIWRVERPTDAPHESPDNYATPLIMPVDGELQLIVSGGDYVTGHSLEDGREIWRLGGFNPNHERNYRTIASSLALDGLIFTTSRAGRPFIAFDPSGASGDVTGKIEKWTNNLGADVPTPTTDGEILYVVNDRGILTALDPKTGEEIYPRQRLEPGTYSSSPLLADGKIYATNEDGTTVVVKAGPEFEILAVNRLDEYTLASPVAVGDEIFVRTMKHLYCIAKQ